MVVGNVDLNQGVVYEESKRFVYADKVGFGHDVGLIKLTKKIHFNANIKPIKLLSPTSKVIRTNLKYASWHLASSNNVSNKLKFYPLAALSEKQCKDIIIRSKLKDAPDLFRNVLCSLHANRNSFARDDGAAIVHRKDQTNTQIAIVSTFVGSKLVRKMPAFHTLLSSHREWIRSTIAKNSQDAESDSERVKEGSKKEIKITNPPKNGDSHHQKGSPDNSNNGKIKKTHKNPAKRQRKFTSKAAAKKSILDRKMTSKKVSRRKTTKRHGTSKISRNKSFKRKTSKRPLNSRKNGRKSFTQRSGTLRPAKNSTKKSRLKRFSSTSSKLGEDP